MEAHAAIAKEDDETTLFGFVVSEVGKRRRRLHFVGHCFRLPGLHYRSFTVFGDEVPEESAFDKVCSGCFPLGFVSYPQAEGVQEEASSESDSSSSTHSSDR